MQKNTSYDVTANIFTGNLEFSHVSAMRSFETLNTDDYVPQMVLNDSITLNYTAKENSSALITTIEWEPTAGSHISNRNENQISEFLFLLILDMICNYYFLLYPTRDEDYLTSFEQHFRQLKVSRENIFSPTYFLNDFHFTAD